MPRVPDASAVTRLRAIQASIVADPVKRSASFVPATPMLLYTLRTSAAGRGMFAPPPAPPVSLPRIFLDLEGVDFDGNNKRYQFNDALPPAANFEAVILDAEGSTPSNVDQITYISMFDLGSDQAIFGDVTIETTPEWPTASFSSDLSEPAISADAGNFPGLATVITFRNVPMITDIAIQFYGNTPPGV